MEELVAFVLKYWLEVLLSGIAAGGAYFIKRYIALTNEDRAKDRKEFQNQIHDDMTKTVEKVLTVSKEDDKVLQEEIDTLTTEVDSLRLGILSLQGRNFKDECRNLLQEGHVITIDEFEQLEEEHDVYNQLGGNHKGDQLFTLVAAKMEHNV